MFQWNAESAQRLVQLQSGAADGIDNVGTDDFDTVKGDGNLQLVERPPLNVFYVGFNVDITPFDNEQVRQAIGYAIDKQRIVDNFYPKGSTVATQFLPTAIPGYTKGFTGLHLRPGQGQAAAARGRLPERLDVKLSYRDVVRGYLRASPRSWPRTSRPSWPQVGINVTLDQQESTHVHRQRQRREAALLPARLGRRLPGCHQLLDYHFGKGASPQFGTGFTDIQALITQGGQMADQAPAGPDLRPGGQLLAQHVPMVPIANGGSATAYKEGRPEPAGQPAHQRAFVAKLGIPARTSSSSSRTASPAACTAPTRPTARRCGSASRSVSRCSPTRSTAPRSSRAWPRATSRTPT